MTRPFMPTYGGEHTVDVHAIFTDFGKDPYDPDSYDFAWTDEYLRVMNLAGAVLQTWLKNRTRR